MRKSRKVLYCGLAVLLLWQGLFIAFPDRLTGHNRIRASTGLPPDMGDLLYFYYYLDLFPVVSEETEKEYSTEGAKTLLESKGSSLVMDAGRAVTTGDVGKIFLFLPGAWLKGSAENPSIKPFNSLFFLFSLCLLFFMFWWIERPILGAFIVWCLGSNSMMTFEAYANHNIFALPMAFGILLIALYLPLLLDLRMKYGTALLLAAVSGLLFGFFKEVRTEIVLTWVSVAVLNLFNRELSWFKRISVIGVLLFCSITTTRGLRSYFESKFDQAYQVVEQAGGHPFAGPKHAYHGLWHPIFCGLGDFDRKYGYQWNDKVAADYARPILLAEYGVDAPEMINCCISSESYDPGGKYPKRIYEIPEYTEVVKNKVLHDIKSDPFWYTWILVQRFVKSMIQSTSIHPLLGIVNIGIDIPTGLALFFAFWLYRKRHYFYVRLILFPLPLLATPLLIYSKKGTTYYVFSNMIALGIALYLWYEAKYAKNRISEVHGTTNSR